MTKSPRSRRLGLFVSSCGSEISSVVDFFLASLSVNGLEIMFRTGIRRFASTAYHAAEGIAQAEAKNQYGIGVSKAQGVVKGLTGGKDHNIPFFFVLLSGVFG